MISRSDPYHAFRSGLTFTDIRRELESEARAKRERGEPAYVTRRTVLGRWRQYKLQAWEHWRRNGSRP